MPDPLPPDLPRLRVLETHYELQLQTVRERIARIQAQAAVPPPEPGYIIQHIPHRGGTGEGRGIVHRETCSLLEGVSSEHLLPFQAYAARVTLEDPVEVNTPCEVCRPEEVLKPEPRTGPPGYPRKPDQSAPPDDG